MCWCGDLLHGLDLSPWFSKDGERAGLFGNVLCKLELDFQLMLGNCLSIIGFFCPLGFQRVCFSPSPATQGWCFRCIRRVKVINVGVPEDGLVASTATHTLQNGSAATPFTTEEGKDYGMKVPASIIWGFLFNSVIQILIGQRKYAWWFRDTVSGRLL